MIDVAVAILGIFNQYCSNLQIKYNKKKGKLLDHERNGFGMLVKIEIKLE